MAIRARQSDIVKIRIERFFWLIAAFYILLVARLVYLQAIHGDYFRDKARHMRAQNIQQPAQRGAILDRDGKPLAVTVYSSQLVCDPTQVKDATRTAAAAAEILGVSPDQILPFVSPGQRRPNGKPVRAVKIPTPVSPDAAERFREYRGLKKWADALAGLSITDKPERSYPAGRDAVHVVGFMVPDDHGKLYGQMGLERSLDPILRGRDGFVQAEVDAHRRVIPDTQLRRLDKEDGPDARLTVDSTIQHMAETELAATCEQHHPVGATAIVMDPKTGDVLAMVSYPSFDPVTRAELKNGPEPLRNYGLSLFEPGSTMKAITASAALQEQVITPQTTFYCSGHLQIGNRVVSCAMHGQAGGHGQETIREVLAHSCNVATAQIGMKLGMEKLHKYLDAFGLLSPTGVGLPYDMRGTLGYGAEGSSTSIAKVSRVAFGQSVMVSPLAMAAAYSAIANGGQLMRPRLVKCFQDATGKVVKDCPPVKVRQAVSPATAELVRSLLEGVVIEGTGRSAKVPGYSVAGKTGTAQKVVPGHKGYAAGKYVASFIGFIPARSPRALIYVVVDEPQGGYYGAEVAAPVFKGIAQRLMWYWKVPPDDPASLDAPKARIAAR